MESKKKRKILAIDDNQPNLILLRTHLEQMGLSALTAIDALQGIELAINQHPDLILLDIMMPGIDGFEACKRLKSDTRTSSIPVIFVSSKDQPCDKIAGLEMGAIDYITKPFNKGELMARISLVLQMIEMQEKLLSLANTDELTGLANRRSFIDILEREILQARISGNDLSAMILDLDHFKSINDTYGHLGGDAILKQMGKILQENIYPLDVAARYGGEEFIILMPATSFEKAAQAAERLRSIIDRWQWKISNQSVSVTTSIGFVSVDPNNFIDSNDLIEKADAALYAAKKRGRNCVIGWSQINPDEDLEQSESREYREMQAKVSSLARQLQSHAKGTISAFAKTIDLALNDPYLLHHADNVQIYAVAIAEEMGLSAELIERIHTAALLHDLGKISIPKNILGKTSPLTEQERYIITKHSEAAAKILAPLTFFKHELSIIKHHHENYDGTGYPGGLKGKEIPIGARILRVADTFDSITSDRIYSNAQSKEAAAKEIDAYSGIYFDPDVVEAFQRTVELHKEDWPLFPKKHLVVSV